MAEVKFTAELWNQVDVICLVSTEPYILYVNLYHSTIFYTIALYALSRCNTLSITSLKSSYQKSLENV